MKMLQGNSYMRSWIAALCIAAGIVALAFGTRIALACCTGCCGPCCYGASTCAGCDGSNGPHSGSPCDDCGECCTNGGDNDKSHTDNCRKNQCNQKGQPCNR